MWKLYIIYALLILVPILTFLSTLYHIITDKPHQPMDLLKRKREYDKHARDN